MVVENVVSPFDLRLNFRMMDAARVSKKHLLSIVLILQQQIFVFFIFFMSSVFCCLLFDVCCMMYVCFVYCLLSVITVLLSVVS